MITSVKIQSTQYDELSKRWTIRFQTPTGQHTAVSKHLVQATGLGSQKFYLPPIKGEDLYKGTSVHSAQYRNAKEFKQEGAKVSLMLLDNLMIWKLLGILSNIFYF